MTNKKIRYDIMLFPTSEQFRVFRVLNGCIWQIISPKTYNIDNGEIEYFDMIFDDMITAEIICRFLQEAQEYEKW